MDTSTGSYSLSSVANNDWLESRRSLAPPPTPSPPDRLRQTSMFGRKKPLWMEPASNWEIDLCVETTVRIGMPSVSLLNEDSWMKYQPTYSFAIMGHSAEFLPIMLSLLQSNERFLCTGVRQGLGSLEEPGMKPDWMHTLKIRALSSGADIEVNNMLCWMSFVAKSELAICSGGWTDIRVWWNKKEAAAFCHALESGLHLTWTRGTGIPIWTKQPLML